MKINFYSSQPYDITFFEKVNKGYRHDLIFHDYALNEETVELVKDTQCICVFVNDKLTASVLKNLFDKGVRLIALRCAGFNNIDVVAADSLGITVVRVPSYSPESIAEHAVGLMLSLSRHIHRAYNRVRESNFSLNGLLGFEFHNATIGVVGDNPELAQFKWRAKAEWVKGTHSRGTVNGFFGAGQEHEEQTHMNTSSLIGCFRMIGNQQYIACGQQNGSLCL